MRRWVIMATMLLLLLIPTKSPGHSELMAPRIPT